MSMKKSSETIGNQTRNLPVCSAVPQPLHHRSPLIITTTATITVTATVFKYSAIPAYFKTLCHQVEG
jgi:hypothetical protein